MQVIVLGSVAAIDHGVEVALGGPTQQRLLAVLVAAGEGGLSRVSIIEQLWSSDDLPADPHGAVRNYVNRLRGVLGDNAVVTRPGGYGLGPISVDASRFEDMVVRARRAGSSPTALGLWAEAVGLWRGRVFDGYEDLELVGPVAARLEELRVEATEAWFEARLAAGESRELAAELTSAVEQHPPLTISADGEQLSVSNLLGGIDSRIFDLSGSDLVEQFVEGVPMTNEFFNETDPLNRWFTSFESGKAQNIDRKTLRPNGFEVEGAVGADVSPDGRYLAVAGAASRPWFRVFDLETGDQVSPDLDMSPWATGQDIGMSAIVYDPTGTRLLASLDSGTGVEFDTTTWETGRIIGPEDHGGARAARFSHDGEILVTRGADGTIVVRDPDSYEVIRTIEGGTGASEDLAPGPYISPDGDYLLTVRETTPRLWHLSSGTVIGAFPNEAGLVATGNDEGDELRLVSLLGDHALVWDMDIPAWPDIACLAAGRNMTVEEWEQFGPGDQPYHPTCPQWPAAESAS